MAGGLALQAGAVAWLAAVSTPNVPYSELVVPFIMAGAGMALVFAPSANAVLGSVRQQEAGQASGADQRDPRAGRRPGRGRARLGVQRLAARTRRPRAYTGRDDRRDLGRGRRCCPPAR